MTRQTVALGGAITEILVDPVTERALVKLRQETDGRWVVQVAPSPTIELEDGLVFEPLYTARKDTDHAR